MLKKTLGIFLVILGIISLFLPILPGILFLLVGALLLGGEDFKDKIKNLIKKIRKEDLRENKKKNPFYLLLRYLILLLLVFSLPIIYKILTPLTVYPTGFLLRLFYPVVIYKDYFIIKNISTMVEIISSCVAGSAYLLLLIFNLSVSMNLKKRIYSILFSGVSLLILNILRIVFLSVLLVNDFKYFDLTHKFFWYILSTVFVVAIWFLTVKIFSIKEIPVYSDFKYLLDNIRKK